MNVHRRDFLLLMTLATAAVTPAFGQAAPPAVGSAESAQSTVSIPDFSGIWGHPYWPSFEPPASGPGPITNRLRGPNGAGNGVRLVGDYTSPILKPLAAEIVKRQGEMELNGGAPTTYNQCWPQGVPFIFFNYGMQMLQQPHQITILYSQDQVRHVRMNEPHPAQVTPSCMGIP
jgi:hypothetical protein